MNTVQTLFVLVVLVLGVWTMAHAATICTVSTNASTGQSIVYCTSN